MRSLSFCLSLALLTGLSSLAQAASPVTQPLGATSAVANSCVIASTDNLNFGTYSPISGSFAAGVSHFQLKCTKAASYAITSNSGMRGNSTLASSGNTLNYGLYTDAAFSRAFGAGTSNAPALPSLDTLVSGASKFCFTGVSIAVANVPANVPYVRYQNSAGSGFTYAYGYVGAIRSGTCSAAFGSSAIGVVTYYASNPPLGPNVSLQTTGTVITGNNVFFYPASLNAYKGTSPSGLSVIDIPIYGQVPANQDVLPGSYSDTVTFTVSF
jgi:spore coat protein U-like protein